MTQPVFSHTATVRVRYSEVDRMGYVYYGNYAQYFEVGRVEAMRAIGLSYAEMEDSGIIMPVSRMETDFRRAARYDQLLTIVTEVAEMPRSAVEFNYRITDEMGDLLCTGMTKLAFVDVRTMRPVRAPGYFLRALEAHQRR